MYKFPSFFEVIISPEAIVAVILGGTLSGVLTHYAGWPGALFAWIICLGLGMLAAKLFHARKGF